VVAAEPPGPSDNNRVEVSLARTRCRGWLRFLLRFVGRLREKFRRTIVITGLKRRS